jgi:hypothetical protein
MSEDKNRQFGEILQDYIFDERNYVKSVRVAYTITADELNPEFITESSGIGPTDCWRMGDSQVRTNPRTGQSVVAKNINGLWRISTKSQIDSLLIKDHIDYLLSIIEPAKEFFKSLCIKEGYRVYFHIFRECCDVQGFFCISSDHLRRISDICQEIEFLCPIEITDDEDS